MLNVVAYDPNQGIRVFYRLPTSKPFLEREVFAHGGLQVKFIGDDNGDCFICAVLQNLCERTEVHMQELNLFAYLLERMDESDYQDLDAAMDWTDPASVMDCINLAYYCQLFKLENLADIPPTPYTGEYPILEMLLKQERERITNYDRLHSLGLEDLAEELVTNGRCDFCIQGPEICDSQQSGLTCLRGAIAWMKQTASHVTPPQKSKVVIMLGDGSPCGSTCFYVTGAEENRLLSLKYDSAFIFESVKDAEKWLSICQTAYFVLHKSKG